MDDLIKLWYNRYKGVPKKINDCIFQCYKFIIAGVEKSKYKKLNNKL